MRASMWHPEAHSLISVRSVLVVLVTTLLGLGASRAQAQGENSFPPSFASVQASYTPSERVLIDRSGNPLDEKRVDAHIRRLEWTRLSEVSPAFRRALLKSEDRRFFDHDGVDWLALAGTVLKYPLTGRLRGASTISMQLTQFLLEHRARSSARSLSEKFDQIRASLELERVWSKEQILEAYLNLVSFRGELQGLRAASRGLFQKAPHGLSALESALLAVLVRSPNAPPDQVAERVCWLEERRGTSCEEARNFVLSSLSRPYQVIVGERLAPVLASRLLLPVTKERAPAQEPREVRTTLDAGLQRRALELLRGHLEILRPQNALDGAVLVLDNKSGDVLAYVSNGGSSYSSAPFVDGIQARRQAGSTLKPFLYATAFERRLLTPVSLLDDSPADFDAGNGSVYRPHNYDNRFHGLITAREALGSSMNIPAVRTLLMISEASALDKFKRLGVTDLREAGHYGPSLALGTLDISLWELTNAYRALAREGLASSARISLDGPVNALLAKPVKQTRVFSKAASFLVSDILSDRENRTLSFGLESPLATRHWTAVKTGTSKDMRDNWCVGFSRRFTVGVWIGNFRGEPMWDVSGISGAAPLWLEIMNELHKDESANLSLAADKTPRPPSDVVRARLTLPNGQMTASFFLKGTEPRQSQSHVELAPPRPRILYPVNDLIVAIDPEIPEQFQKVAFEVSGASAQGFDFVLDGKKLAPASGGHLWSPLPGRHTLELKNAQGRTEDRVSFLVK